MAHANNISRSLALRTAWAIRKQSPALSWGTCQKMAWAALRLKTQMQSGAVAFSYTKEDGTTRAAVGTLCPSLFNYESKGTGKETTPAVVRYFDLEAGGFRSFRADRLTAA